MVLVLWFVAAAAAIAVQMGQSVRATALQARNAVDTLRVQAELDGARALAVAAVRLDVMPADGTLAWMSADGTSVRVAVAPEGGKLDLNEAEEETLTAALQGLADDSETGAALAQAILDYRDEDEATRPDGAEAQDYAAADAPFGPANGTMRHTSELRAVAQGSGLGPTGAALLERLLPEVTVATGRFDVDSQAASPSLANALSRIPGLNDGPSAGEDEDDGFEPEEPMFPLDPAGLYGIDANVRLQAGLAGRERAVVWLTSLDPRKRIEVLELNTGMLPEDSGAAP